MRAVIFNGPHDLQIGEWETPQAGPGEVVVAVKAAGICSADTATYLGKWSKQLAGTYPRVAGHEMAGVVAELGEGVTGIRIGDAVAVEPVIGCDQCYACRIGKYNCCTNMQMLGSNRSGGFAEYVAAPIKNLHPIPHGMTMIEAACVEPTTIGLQACRRAEIRPGEYVLVLGCGPIGLAVIEVGKALGARMVGSDILPARLEAAATLGVETEVGGDGLIERIRSQTGGAGAAVVIEAVGLPPVIEQTVELVASGGRIVIVGVVKDGAAITTDGRAWTGKELTVLGSRNSVNCFPECIRLIHTGAVTFPRMAAAHSMWDAPRVFEEMVNNPGSLVKNVLVN